MSPPRPVPEHENGTNTPETSSASTSTPATAVPTEEGPVEDAQTAGSRSTNAQPTSNAHQDPPNTRNTLHNPNEQRESSTRDGRGSPSAPEVGESRTFTFPNAQGASFESIQESFTERLHNFIQAHRQEQHHRNDSSGSEQDTLHERNAGASQEQPSMGSPNSMSIFDEILDTVLGHRSNEQASRPAPNSEPTPNSNSNSAGAHASAGTGASEAAANVSNVDGATVFTTSSPGDNPSAIVITVNYMFMDGADEPAPGRTGSLVVTIPNNATNREPHIISSFISLATRMAYSALINNGPKPKPGITLEKFRSFKSLNVDDLADKTCSVCFEQYDRCPAPNVEDLITTKRRKLSPTSHVPSGSATPEQHSSETAQIEQDRPPSTDADSIETTQGEDSRPDTEPEGKIYLCDHDEEFDHTPVEMPCKHVFGRSCLAQWLKESTSCPLCRSSVADPDQQAPRRNNIPPISYIRFGGLGGPSGDLFSSPSDGSQQGGANEEDNGNEGNSSDPNPQSTGQSQTSENGQNEPNSLPALLRRATQVIFNQSGRRNRETPPPPLETGRGSGNTRERNPPFSPVINNIQNYFRRARRQRDGDSSGSSSLFTSGVSSRRTPNGVETVASDSDPLRSLFGSSSLFMNEFGSSARSSRGSRNSENASGEQTPSRPARDQQHHQHHDDQEDHSEGSTGESHP
ncbi:hypothetical protein JCM33374_g3718 [Metschnikowia sp. JCM 33374]|nr:hypothetical protein JCM33374_g3718 [Metschnikowia sp. JCM 33374]